MPKMLADQNRKLTYVPSVVAYKAPTVTELNAGIDLQCLVTAADFQFGTTGEETKNEPALCSITNSALPGRITREIAMNFFRWDGALEDVPWDTFTDAGINGFLYLRIGKDHSTVWAAADKAQGGEVVSGSPMTQNPDGGTGFEKFRLNFYPQDNFTDRAVVAAGG